MRSESTSAAESHVEGRLVFRSFRALEDLDAGDRQDLVELYESLFSGFHLDLAEVQQMVSHPRALNVMILRTAPAGTQIIGFYSGVPLRDVDWLAGGLRLVVRLTMRRSFFMTAFGLDSQRSGLSFRNLVETYEDIVRRVVEQGYGAIIALARAEGSRTAGVESNNRGMGLARHMVERCGARRVWRPVELAPGEWFVPIRLGRLERNLHRFRRMLKHESR